MRGEGTVRRQDRCPFLLWCLSRLSALRALQIIQVAALILILLRRGLLNDLLTGLHHLVGPLLGSVQLLVLVALLVVTPPIVNLLKLPAVILVGLQRRLLGSFLTGLHHLVGPLLCSVLPVVLVALLVVNLLELAAVAGVSCGGVGRAVKRRIR